MAEITVNSSGLIKALARIENNRATKNVTEPEFEMHCPVSLQFLIGIGCLIFAVFAALGVIFIDEDEGKLVCGCFFGLLSIVSLVCIFYYRHWKLKFDNYGLEYTPGFGCTRELRYPEILSVHETAGSLTLKTEDAPIHIPYYTIGLNIFLWRLEKEHFEIESRKAKHRG